MNRTRRRTLLVVALAVGNGAAVGAVAEHDLAVVPGRADPDGVRLVRGEVGGDDGAFAESVGRGDDDGGRAVAGEREEDPGAAHEEDHEDARDADDRSGGDRRERGGKQDPAEDRLLARTHRACGQQEAAVDLGRCVHAPELTVASNDRRLGAGRTANCGGVRSSTTRRCRRCGRAGGQDLSAAHLRGQLAIEPPPHHRGMLAGARLTPEQRLHSFLRRFDSPPLELARTPQEGSLRNLRPHLGDQRDRQEREREPDPHRDPP